MCALASSNSKFLFEIWSRNSVCFTLQTCCFFSFAVIVVVVVCFFYKSKFSDSSEKLSSHILQESSVLRFSSGMLSSQILEDYVVSIQVLLMLLLFFFSGWGLEEYLVGSFSPLQDCIHQSSLYLSINSGCSSLSSNGNGWHVIWTAKEAALEASSRVVKVIENSKYPWANPLGRHYQRQCWMLVTRVMKKKSEESTAGELPYAPLLPKLCWLWKHEYWWA